MARVTFLLINTLYPEVTFLSACLYTLTKNSPSFRIDTKLRVPTKAGPWWPFNLSHNKSKNKLSLGDSAWHFGFVKVLCNYSAV